MVLVTMNDQELKRLRIIQDLVSERIKAKAAAEVLGLSRRQVHRLRERFGRTGAPALASPRRGKRSNRQLPSSVRRQVLDIVREHYGDFGPTLAREKLQERHGFTIAT